VFELNVLEYLRRSREGDNVIDKMLHTGRYLWTVILNQYRKLTNQPTLSRSNLSAVQTSGFGLGVSEPSLRGGWNLKVVKLLPNMSRSAIFGISDSVRFCRQNGTDRKKKTGQNETKKKGQKKETPGRSNQDKETRTY